MVLVVWGTSAQFQLDDPCGDLCEEKRLLFPFGKCPSNVGEKVPLVTVPIVISPNITGCPFRGIALSIISKHINRLENSELVL